MTLDSVARTWLRAMRVLMLLGLALGIASLVDPSMMRHGSRWIAAELIAVALFNLWQFRGLR